MKPHGVHVPLDTLGNALPFPVASGKVCRLKPSEWAGMWTKLALGTLPAEADCSVCGEYFELRDVFPLERRLMHPTVQRQALNTSLTEARICGQCKAHCAECRRIVPRAQKKRANDLCQVCADGRKSTPTPQRR